MLHNAAPGPMTAKCVALAIACLSIIGCDFSRPANPCSRTITDKTGTNQLALVYIPVGPIQGPQTMSFEFHSLAWKTREGTNWIDLVVITKADFEAGTTGGRAVRDIYSFDPGTGNAIIKVGESAPPQTNGNTITTACVYSWREWNVLTNHEVRMLRVCSKPSEPFKDKPFKLFN